MLVGGELSSRSPHYEGSERDDSVKVVKRGLDLFWWRELKQRHDGCLMSWKWRYRDHPCRSQNLPQNICYYYINELIFELSSWWQGAKQLGPDEADEDQAGTNRLELCFALPTHISPVCCWDKLLLRRLELSSWWQRAKQTKTRQGPTVWNCALRCQLIYRQSAAGTNCC